MSKKKSEANVEKLVDAKIRRRRSPSEKGKSRSRELDPRASKGFTVKLTN